MTARHDDVVLCAEPGCPRAAAYGPFCVLHRSYGGTRSHGDLTEEEYADLRARVAADAAPLFLLAMQFILSQQVHALAEEAAALEAGR